MKILNISKLLLFSYLTGMVPCLHAVDFIRVGEQSSTQQASIAIVLNNENNNAASNAFLANETINLTFQLNIAAEDIGLQRSLFLVAKKDQQFYMKTSQGQWLTWNGHRDSLQPVSTKQLQRQETLQVLESEQLPPGEYHAYAGYEDLEHNIQYNRMPFMIADESEPALHRIQSAEFLGEYLNNTQSSSGSSSSGGCAVCGGPVALDGAEFSGTNNSPASTDSSSNVSQTNLQEAGVDESDRIKVRGNTLFALEECTSDNGTGNSTGNGTNSSQTIGISLAEDSLFAPIAETNSACLSSYRLQETPASASRLDKITLNSSGFASGSLFLNEASAESSSDRLIWLSSNMLYDIWGFWGMPYYWSNNTTTLKFFDISDPENLSLQNTITLEGALISSRRIGDHLYLITRKNHYDVTPLADAVQETDVSVVLPTFTLDDNAQTPLVTATNCYVPASQSNRSFDGTIVTITSLSISNPENYQSSCVVGNVETAYVSTEALYLATSRYPYNIVDNFISYNQAPEYSTEIHKFAFTDDHVNYIGSGNVPGHLGWEMDKKPFRMGEHNGVLKVATSLGENWGNDSTTRVGVLRENSAQNALEEISFLDNLGHPGEKLYAARFIGNRGYLVTFRVTDPLYMLDFTVPESPSVLGELEINGYSDYLHPIGENYLLGIGKDAVADNLATDFIGRGAWYQGVKLSLFDVSDGQSLREIQSVIIGNRGTSSAVLTDHHALAWLATDDPEHFRLAIPIDEHSTEYNDSDYSQPSAFYDWTQTGAYVFDIQTGSSPDLSLSGSLITESLQQGDEQVYSETERIVLQGDSLHYIHNNTLFSSALDDL